MKTTRTAKIVPARGRRESAAENRAYLRGAYAFVCREAGCVAARLAELSGSDATPGEIREAAEAVLRTAGCLTGLAHQLRAAK